LPELHTWSPTQVTPQPPQLSGSDWTATHAPLQSISPDGHWHEPATQAASEGHDVPHAPQFAGSVASDTQAPSQSV